MSYLGITNIITITTIKTIKTIKDTKTLQQPQKNSCSNHNNHKDLNTNYGDYGDYGCPCGVQKRYAHTPHMRGCNALETAKKPCRTAPDRILRNLMYKLAIKKPVLEPENSPKITVLGFDKNSYRNHEA